MTPTQLHALMVQHVKDHGRGIISTMNPQDLRMPMAYTVGLTRSLRHPDLIVFGLPHETAERTFDMLISEIPESGPIIPGPEIRVTAADRMAVWIEVLTSTEPYQLISLDTEPRAMLQLVLPDEKGRLPWDPGCETAWQPLLGRRPRLN